MVFHPDRVPCTRPSSAESPKQILETQLADDVKGWLMQSDGGYHRRPSSTSSSRLRSQEKLYELLVDG